MIACTDCGHNELAHAQPGNGTACCACSCMRYRPPNPRMAFAVVIDRDRGGFTLGVAKEGEKGYHPYTRAACHPTFDAAQQVADQQNQLLGLTPKDAALIVASTMGGFGKRKRAVRTMTALEMMARSTVLRGLHRTLADHATDLIVRIAALDVDPEGATTLALRVREAREFLEAMKETRT